jgi:hypothetical protein
MTTWSDAVDWWADPRLAYAKGLNDGYARGWAEATARADIDIVSALTQMFGGPDCTDRKEAVRRHLQHLDHLKARQEWQERIGPRPTDYQGGPVDWETGRPLR